MKNELKNCPFCGGEAYIDRVAASLKNGKN